MPTDAASDGPFASGLDEAGPGLVGVGLRVTDDEEAKAELAEKGLTPVTSLEATEFSEYYYHHKPFGGIYLSISEVPDPLETTLKVEGGGLHK